MAAEQFTDPEDLLIEIAGKLTVALRILKPVTEGLTAKDDPDICLICEEDGIDLIMVEETIRMLRDEARKSLRGVAKRHNAEIRKPG